MARESLFDPGLQAALKRANEMGRAAKSPQAAADVAALKQAEAIKASIERTTASAAAPGAAPAAAPVAPTTVTAGGGFGAAREAVNRFGAPGAGKVATAARGLGRGLGVLQAGQGAVQTAQGNTASGVENLIMGAATAINPVIGTVGNVLAAGRDAVMQAAINRAIPAFNPQIFNPALEKEVQTRAAAAARKIAPAAPVTAPAAAPAAPAPAPAPTGLAIDDASVAVPSGTGVIRNTRTGRTQSLDTRAAQIAGGASPIALPKSIGGQVALGLNIARENRAATLKTKETQALIDLIKAERTNAPKPTVKTGSDPLTGQITDAVVVDPATGTASRINITRGLPQGYTADSMYEAARKKLAEGANADAVNKRLSEFGLAPIK